MELYGSGGKHAKQNPKVPKLGITILAGALTISTLAACVTNKKDKPIDMPTEALTVDTLYPRIDADFNGIIGILKEHSNLYYDNDHTMMTTDGYILKYIDNVLNDIDISQKDKMDFLNELLDSNSLMGQKMYYHIHDVDRGYNMVFVNTQEIDLNNIEAFNKQHGNLCSCIKKYSEIYKVPADIMISIALSNMENGKVNYSNAMGIPSNWGRLETSRTAYNYEKNKRDNLYEEQNNYMKGLNENVKYSCMVLANCLKDANGDLYGALKSFYGGAGFMEGNKHVNADKCRDTVLSYLMAFKNSHSLKLDYDYTFYDTPEARSIVFEDNNYYFERYGEIISEFTAMEEAYATGKGK